MQFQGTEAVKMIIQQPINGLMWSSTFKSSYFHILYKQVFRKHWGHKIQSNQINTIIFFWLFFFQVFLLFIFHFSNSFIFSSQLSLKLCYSSLSNKYFSKVTWEPISVERQISPFNLQIACLIMDSNFGIVLQQFGMPTSLMTIQDALCLSCCLMMLLCMRKCLLL